MDRLVASDAAAYAAEFVADGYPPPGLEDAWDDPGRLMFTMWANKFLVWEDLEPLNYDVDLALLAAAPEAFLGSRACFPMTVLDWPRHPEVPTVRVLGESDDGRIVDIWLVGTSRPLTVAQHEIVCGFIFGRHGRADLDDDAGVSMVGMIDNAENRLRVAEGDRTLLMSRAATSGR